MKYELINATEPNLIECYHIIDGERSEFPFSIFTLKNSRIINISYLNAGKGWEESAIRFSYNNNLLEYVVYEELYKSDTVFVAYDEEGLNISQVKYSWDTEPYDLTFDNHTNPYMGYLGVFCDWIYDNDLWFTQYFNSNNWLHEESGDFIGEVKYVYNDEDYPTSWKMTDEFDVIFEYQCR